MKNIRKSIPFILMLWPYLFFLIFLLPDDCPDSLITCLHWGYIVLTIVVYSLNIWNAFAPGGYNSAQKLAFYDMLIKLVHIPFYLAVFMLGILLAVIMVVPAFVFLSPFMMLLLFFVDLCLMLTSSMYGIKALILALAEGKVPKGKLFWYGAFHFVFVLDVVGALGLYRTVKKHVAKSDLP